MKAGKKKTTETRPEYVAIKLQLNVLTFTEIKYNGENEIPFLKGNRHIISLLLQGEYFVVAQGKMVVSRRGEVTLFSDGSRTATEQTKYGTQIFVFALSEEWCAFFGVTLPEFPPQKFLRGSEEDRQVKEIYEAYRQNEEYSHLLIQGALLKLIAMLLRKQKPPRSENFNWHEFFTALTNSGDFIRLSFPAIAKKAKVSERQLNRMIFKHFGCTYRTLHSNMKVEKVAELLEQGVRDREELTERCGYQDYDALCKQFKKKHHCKPHEYYENTE